MKAFLKEPGLRPHISDVPNPTPQKGEVLLKVHCVGICRTDIFVASGKIWRDQPIILGHEFCGEVIEHIPSEEDPFAFPPGAMVAVNPLYPNQKFMGLHFHGALCEQICVPSDQVYLIPSEATLDPKVIAYAEPVAASLAVLTPENLIGKGAIYGNNRIAALTQSILETFHYPLPILSENDPLPENHYDFLIETKMEAGDPEKLCWALVPDGRLILKSRILSVPFPVSIIVTKQLHLRGASYGLWSVATHWLTQHHDRLQPLIGKSFPFEQAAEAFEYAGTGEFQKTFIQMS